MSKCLTCDILASPAYMCSRIDDISMCTWKIEKTRQIYPIPSLLSFPLRMHVLCLIVLVDDVEQHAGCVYIYCEMFIPHVGAKDTNGYADFKFNECCISDIHVFFEWREHFLTPTFHIETWYVLVAFINHKFLEKKIKIIYSMSTEKVIKERIIYVQKSKQKGQHIWKIPKLQSES